MTGSQIRQKFLDYFAQRGHRVVRSSSLVPANDPTLLFTNAGMNQFKDVFLGQEKRDYTRAATSQKCVRAGGKHNDLDNVGYTRRHQTFFEMLGNFSFGDYFKQDAIAFAWELITKEYGIPKDRLYVTVFREDDDAEALWQKVAGVSKDRIFRLDEKDNFWQMGDTGPCGPCSEIHFDLGPEGAEPGREHEQFPLDGGGRFVEFWNLVFMQFDRDQSGKMTPLPKPSIDTGMGLERITSILQGKITNYETDILRPIVDRAGELLRKSYGDDSRADLVLRINADHARSTAFLINDGVVPANEGRGYVLRKIMRRAMRNARMIGTNDPYLYKLTGFVAEQMRDAYPDLMESVQRVARIVKDEEHRYATTFAVAEKFFHDEAKAAAGGVLPGPAAFKLYDTYGLALDEQEEMAREAGLSIDRDGFAAEMEKQRTRARASWKGADKAQVNPVYQALPRTEFIGRDTLESSATVAAVLDGQKGSSEIALDRTPFYAEAGGQVGDTGVLVSTETGDTLAIVETTYSAAPGKSVHKIKTLAPIKIGDTVIARVDPDSRYSTMRNHTGTHLLHAALRKVLGTHVKQAGSVVETTRLRFDFSHYTAMDSDELAEVERLMNEEILANREVVTNIMDLDQALQTGAMALFGEKYGDEVRVVQIDTFSKELCGGTHVSRTGDIGICKIVYEGSISAGVRRIEAITGLGALLRFQEAQEQLAKIAGVDVEKLKSRERSLEHELQQLKTKMAQAEGRNLDPGPQKFVVRQIDGMDKAQLRVIVDDARNRHPESVFALGTNTGEVITSVPKDLTAKIQADKLIRAAGAKGGGRPDMAEGRVQDVAAFLDTVRQMLEESLYSVESFDVVVVGAGPTGLACGIELKRRGLTVVLIDKGCVVNSLYNYPTNLVFFTTPELLEIGDIPMTSLNEKPVRNEALKYYRRVAQHYDLDIRQYQRVSAISGDDGAFVTHSTDSNGCPHTYASKKVILSLGYYDVPNLMNVPGEDLPKVVHYYKEPHPYYGQDVLIVGAKNSAVIAALELWWSGSRVTMVHRGSEIHKNVKYWLKPNIENRIKNGEIPMHWNSRIAEIRPNSVLLETPSGPLELKNDFVFAMTGYRPDTEFLEAHGIVFDPETQRPRTNPDTLESDRTGMYLAGVIVAGMHTHEIFIENGRFHGKQIAAAIAAKLK